MREAEPYSLLAAGYEQVMAHVDYIAWAMHVRRLLARHHRTATDILELGCGTGALARRLQPLGPPPDGYRYRATDASAAMIREARKLAAGTPIQFEQADFLSVPADPPADVTLLLYDGLNYLLDSGDVCTLFSGVAAALRPDGVFVFDQSTPTNSLRHADGFDDAGNAGTFDYWRTSEYEPASRRHRTTFRLRLPDGSEATEVHVQRAYSIEEMEVLMAASPLEPVAAYDGMTLRPAHAESERVHWVVRARS